MTARTLLACGIGYALVYVVANDLVAAAIYDGYDPVDQALSELSATGASSRGFLAAMMPVFALLLVAFGLGVRRAGAGNRALRATGAVLVLQGALFPLWLLAPMTSRDEMAGGAPAANDVGHLALTAAAILFILLEFGFGAVALGRRFRVAGTLHEDLSCAVGGDHHSRCGMGAGGNSVHGDASCEATQSETRAMTTRPVTTASRAAGTRTTSTDALRPPASGDREEVRPTKRLIGAPGGRPLGGRVTTVPALRRPTACSRRPR